MGENLGEGSPKLWAAFFFDTSSRFAAERVARLRRSALSLWQPIAQIHTIEQKSFGTSIQTH
jgi:hypothetical protein